MSKATTQPKGRPTLSGAERRAAHRVAAKRRQRRSWAITITVAVLVIGGVVAAAINSTSGGGTGTTDAEAFDLPALGSEGRVRLADFRGTPTVVNMFASWCDQCDAELPEFRRLAGELDGEVNFVFVNSNETGDWRPMAERHDLLDLAVAKDVGGTQGNGLYRSYGGTGGMPLTAFYDADGRLINVQRGALLGDSLSQALQQLFAVTP
jgi:cytochrome c biogenesis protein CcmG/thiol:disulfide interchange protein DsbE